MSTNPELPKPSRADVKKEREIMKYAEKRGWGSLFKVLKDLEQTEFSTTEEYEDAVYSAVTNFLDSQEQAKAR